MKLVIKGETFIHLFSDQSIKFGTGFDKFLASHTNEYYRYQGSLTTPPCSEAVVWTVFENKNTISSSQVYHLVYIFGPPL